jgi:hypothetical protein
MSDDTGLRLIAFEKTSAKDVLAKLHREIDRIDSSIDHDHVGDHVVNAFWTAWHFHEWLWAAINEKPALKAAVLKYRGLDSENIDNRLSFGMALADRFVPLKICRVIATSSRHVSVTLAKPSMHPELSAIDDIGHASADEEQHLSTLHLSFGQDVPAVVVMGRPVVATRLLKEVEDYWVTLIHECGVEVLR